VLAAVTAGGLSAQTVERLTFDVAVRRALASNPTVQQAAADILQAEALALQVRSQSLPTIAAAVATNVIDPITRFSGSAISPRTQAVTTADMFVPLVVPARWAEWSHAEDQVLVSQRGADDARRQIGVATGEAYLAIIAQRQVLELNERARDTARAHFEYANQRFLGGIGSRLNAVRAEQEVSSDERAVEEARLLVLRAQEALGVLVAADGPIDVTGEPAFELPPSTIPDADLIASRADVRLVQARVSAAQRRAADSWKEYLPSVTALFTPQMLTPSGLFANTRSWRAAFLFAVPVFDGGQRRGQARERQALVDVARSERTEVERQASSEIRIAREAVAAFERALAYAQRAADQANEVVRITDIAFREGANTNIELIDAQREARDAETAVAIAAHAVRRARLELLVATGRFPQ
jgi:multidrug efflux system outer membrane protein